MKSPLFEQWAKYPRHFAITHTVRRQFGKLHCLPVGIVSAVASRCIDLFCASRFHCYCHTFCKSNPPESECAVTYREKNKFFSTQQIPESPNWLLVKGRLADAKRSLCWLRGWVSPNTVHNEFTLLHDHIASTQKAFEKCEEEPTQCCHVKLTFWDKCRELRQTRTLKPFLLANSLLVFQEFAPSVAMKHYMIQILKAHGIPTDAHLTATTLSLLSTVAAGCFLVAVKLFGKRRLFLCSAVAVGSCCLGLSNYLNFNLLVFVLWKIRSHFKWSRMHRYLWVCVLSAKLDII